MTKPALRVAMIAGDEREVLRQWDRATPYFGSAPAALIDGLAGVEDLELHILSCTRQPLPAPLKLAPNTFYHSVMVPRWGYLKTLYVPAIRALRQKLRTIRPDVVHGQGTEREYALAAAFSGYRNVVTIHGNMRSLARRLNARPFSFHWLTARLESLALRNAGGVICNSAYTEDQVRGAALRTWRVPNALLPDFFQPPTAARGSEPVLLNVGHVAIHKNQVALLEMAERLHQRGHRFRWVFAGGVNPDSDYGRRFLAAIERGQKSGWASYLGNLNRAELIRQMDSAHALVHVATEESFGLAVAEALARNLRLFAFGVGGVLDIASQLPEATLVQPLDWPGLADALEAWARAGHPCGGGAAQAMRERYSPASIAAAHVGIYRGQ